MRTFVFPGQGSQSRGMGKDLFGRFKDLTEKADKILGYSIEELCLKDPRRELNKTQFTQPALYVVNAFSYYARTEDKSDKPDFLAGHSLGEFNALLAGECFDFQTGLKLVKKRGELMSQAKEGAMAAIMNATKEEILEILEKNGLHNIDLANFNTLSQTVISGTKDEIVKAESLFQNGKILYYPLNTSGAFHSRFMQPAKEKFEAYLKKFKFSDLKIPVISNVTAKPYGEGEVLFNLSNQIISGVRWFDTIRYLIQLDSENAMEFEEIGQGDVLTKMVTKIKQELADISAGATYSKSTADKTVTETAKLADPVPSKINVKHSEDIPTDNPTPKNNFKNLFALAEQKVNSWNSKYSVGTRVKSSIMDDEYLETRTEAVVLFGHRAAVYMKKYNGYFDLDEISAV